MKYNKSLVYYGNLTCDRPIHRLVIDPHKHIDVNGHPDICENHMRFATVTNIIDHIAMILFISSLPVILGYIWRH